jgi:hypothetical protein
MGWFAWSKLKDQIKQSAGATYAFITAEFLDLSRVRTFF